MQDNNYANFSAVLLHWHKTNKRSLPWKNSKDPYLTWLSEIILQQTQIVQGLPFYEKISKKYPTVKHLASAPLPEIMKIWEGLGYYSRARNLHQTAKYIAYECGGQFPNSYEGLLKLKGVGTYTAAAIASFAFDKPHAVVDGNVFRVLARLFGIKKPIDTTDGKKYFTHLADKLIDKKNPAAYNQAIMDFGSTVCTPKSPLCAVCPFSKKCVAKIKNVISSYPVKIKKLIKTTRYFNYLLIEYGNKIYLNHRTGNDIWKNLHELPVIENNALLNEKHIINSKEWKTWLKGLKPKIINISGDYVQQLSHQTIKARFYKILINSPLDDKYGFMPIHINKIGSKAFPKIILDYLKTISNFRN